MTSLIDVGMKTLTLNDKTFKLLSIAGKGGSSIVYKVRPVDASDYYMIKEFYPHNLVQGRKSDGTVIFNDGMKAFAQSLKERVLREAGIVDKLRHDDEDKNNNPWFLNYSKPVSENNTLYTVIHTEKGETLHERIYDGYYSESDYSSLCDCILDVLKAIEPIHNKGYLHLDISPDNIYCSNVMRMIDYNSAYSISDHSDVFFPSFKKGYSAPELKNATASTSLCQASDLYSVAAIFFTLLKKRPPEEMDGVNPSRWLLTNKEGSLKGASKLLVDKTNAFVRNNLAKIPAKRLQSVAEMREKITKLKKLSQRIELTNNPKRPNPHFVCRSSEIKAIDEQLQKNRYVILEGIGGIGKTELAKKYAWDNCGKYDIIQFVTYTGNLMTTVAYSLEFRNFDKDKAISYERMYGNDAAKYIFRDKMNTLKQKDNDKTLIIVDNYNTVFDAHFAEFTSGEYKVIFTSREKHSEGFIEITKMKSEDDLLTLFREYYPNAIDKEQENAVREIIRIVLGHTMTLMLIATAMFRSEIKPEEMLIRLKKGLDPKLRTKIAVDKEELSTEDRENVVYGHIRNLFNMEDILSNDNYVYIMTNMSIIPHTGVEKKWFYDWALSERYKSDEYDDMDYTDVNWLIDRRWIQEETREETQRISLHPVISDLAYRELRPDSVNCSEVLSELLIMSRSDDDDEIRSDVKRELIDLLELALLRIDDESDTMTGLMTNYAQLHYSIADYEIALEYYKKAAVVFERIMQRRNSRRIKFENDWFIIADMYTQIGNIYQTVGRYETAVEWYQKSIQVNKKKLWEWEPENAKAYIGLAEVYQLQGKSIRASISLHKAEIIVNTGLENLKRNDEFFFENKSAKILCRIYSGMGACWLSLREPSKALEYYRTAQSIYENKVNDCSPNLARLYSDMGDAFAAQQDYTNALAWSCKALRIREELLGKEHPDTVAQYFSIRNIYLKKKDYEKALEWCKKCLNALERAFGEEYSIKKGIYQTMAVIYENLGEQEKAREYHKKAQS